MTRNELRKGMIATVVAFVPIGIVIVIVIAFPLPEFLGLGVVIVVASLALLGTAWFYRLDRSYGVYTIAAMLFGGAIYYMGLYAVESFWYLILAAVYGTILALQPWLAPKLNARFEKWDDQAKRWKERNGKSAG